MFQTQGGILSLFFISTPFHIGWLVKAASEPKARFSISFQRGRIVLSLVRSLQPCNAQWLISASLCSLLMTTYLEKLYTPVQKEKKTSLIYTHTMSVSVWHGHCPVEPQSWLLLFIQHLHPVHVMGPCSLACGAFPISLLVSFGYRVIFLFHQNCLCLNRNPENQSSTS